MAPPDKEVLDTLVDVGDSLLNHISSVDQLLGLLDKLEKLLSTLDQGPDGTVKGALLPSMKALISNELFRHSDEHVKISVASCITEITRITAPEAPYNDEQMKEIFKLIVEAFEKLSHLPSHSYEKAVLIVDNVARIRSCLLMMDLECDDLIIQMFQLFLRVIRPNHPEVVTFAMEAIMTMVLNENEEISTDLLWPLLHSVKKENQTISPVSWSLAEKVLTNCADKLQSCLMRAVQSTDRPLDAYADVVVSICQRGSETLQCNNLNGSRNPLVQADENELAVCKGADEQSCDVIKDLEPDMTCARDDAQTIDDAELNERNSSSTADSEIIEKKGSNRQLHSDLMKNDKRINTRTNFKYGNSKSVENPNSEAELDVMPKKRGHKPNSLMNPEEGYDHSWICMDRKSAKSVQSSKVGDSGCHVPPENLASRKNKLQLESENVGEVYQPKTEKTIKPRKACDKILTSQKEKLLLEPKSAGELSQPKTRKTKRTYQFRKACDSDIELSPSANHALLKDTFLKKLENMAKGSEAQVSQPKTDENLDATHPSTNHSIPDRSHRKRGRPKKNSITNNQGVDPRSVSVIKKDHLIAQHEDISKTDEKSAVATGSIVGETISKPREVEEKPKPGMNVQAANIEEDQALTQTNVKKRRKLDAPPNKDVSDSSTKQLTESATKTVAGAEETPQTRPRRKRTTASEMRDCNEPLVGSKIKVWWPMDKRFYEGVVDSYDFAKGKHKILYADGDVEVLNLKRQRWELITDHVSPDAEQGIDLQQIEVVASNTAEKRNGNSESKSAKGAKANTCQTRGRASARISKSAEKSKDKSALDEPGVADESAVDPPRTNNEQDSAGKSKSKRLKNVSDMKRIKSKDNSALDEPIVADESAVDPAKSRNEEDSAAKSKTKRLKIVSDVKKIKPKDNSAPGEPVVADESAIDPAKTKNEQDSGGKSKTKRLKIVSDMEKIKPKDNSALDEPVVADESAFDPPRTNNEQDSAGKSKTRRSKIVSDVKKIKPKDNSALDEPIVADEFAVDLPRTNNEQDSAGKSKAKRSKTVSDMKKSKPRDNPALDEPIVADESEVDPSGTKNEQDSAGKSKTKKLKIVSDMKRIKPKDNLALDEPIVADESAVDPPRTNNEQDSAGKPQTKRLKIVSDMKKIKPEDNSALDESVVADESAVDPSRTNNEQGSAGKSKTKKLKIVSSMKKIKHEADSVQKSKLRKA